MDTAIAIVSGGLDSVVLAHLLHSHGYALHLLAFDYGQQHVRELNDARACANDLGARYTQIDLRALVPVLGGSALTGDQPVPDGHYAAPEQRATVVPNRNAILLTIAYAAAVREGARVVAAGFHAGDAAVYPDCRQIFVWAFTQMQLVAVEGYGDPGLHLFAPFVDLEKHDIVEIGQHLAVPFERTWSCYRGESLHCGTCGTCVERKEAFRRAGVADPTVYTA